MIKLTENVNSDYFQLFKYIPFNQIRLSDYKLTNDRRIIDQQIQKKGGQELGPGLSECPMVWTLTPPQITLISLGKLNP